MVASWASILSFFGCVAAGFSPALVLAITVIAPEPVRVVLAIFAAFLWLIAMTLVAFVWWALVPLRTHLWVLVIYSTLIQEGCRWANFALYDRLMRGLRAIGLQPAASAKTTAASIVPAAVATGLGAGVMQALVMYGDVFAGALRPGTLYAPSCSHLSVFAVAALNTLAFTSLSVLLSILGWTTAYPRGSLAMWTAIVLLHLLASAATLLHSELPLGMRGEGCAIALPCVFVVVLLAAALTWRVAATRMCVPRLTSVSSTASEHAS